MNYELREKKLKILYTFWGKVIGGKKRGKILGYPTANIALHKKIPEGIYAAKVTIHGVQPENSSSRVIPKKRGIVREYLAATFIGAAKTFKETEYKSESFILDFNQDLYGVWLTVCLFKKLRENKKFNSEKELIDQIKKDILATHNFFS